MTPIRIGTRRSKLALWQAEHVQRLIIARFPGLSVELVPFTTQGDIDLHTPLAELGGQGLFTQELEAALRSGEIDLAVHSLKDLPTENPEGVVIGAVTERGSPFDALVTRERLSLSDLPHGAVVGTGSERRAAQLFPLRPDLVIKPMRGNVETRVRKVDDGEYDAAVLAVAGLERLGIDDRIDEVFSPPVMLPAPAQGAIAVQARSADLQEILRAIDHFETRVAVTAEREFLRHLESGCSLPVAAYSTVHGNRVRLQGRVSDLAGRNPITVEGESSVEECAELGRFLAEAALNQGAADLLTTIKRELER